MRSFVIAAVAALAFASAADAKQCRDDKGKFVKCPPGAATIRLQALRWRKR